MSTSTRSGTAKQAGLNGRSGLPATEVTVPRRRPAFVVGGALLVVVSGLAFMWIQLRSDASVSVLAVARPVSAGQVLTAADVTAVAVVPDPRIRLVPASQAVSVVGRSAAVPLLAGALLSPDQVGPPAWPAPGEAVVAVPVKPGRLPAGVTPGARVQVYIVSSTGAQGGGATGSPPAGPEATVVDVARDVDASGTVVVSLLLHAADVGGVATGGGDVTLVLLGPAG